MNAKKIICAALAAVSICCLPACGDSDGAGSSKKEKTSSSNAYDANDDDVKPSADSGDSDGDSEADDDYVSKTKQTAADSAASSLSKSISSVMVDMDCRGEDVSGEYWLTGANIGASGENLDPGAALKIKDMERFAKSVKNYFTDIEKCSQAGAYCVDGYCVAVYVKIDNGYFGTYPSGIIDHAENRDGKIDAEECRKRLEEYVKANSGA